MKRRRRRRKNPSTTTAARANPRRRRRGGIRRRRNPNGSVAAVGTAVAGAVAGAGAGYAMDTYGVGSPKMRSAGLVIAGVLLGAIVGRKRPDLGTALGAGIATAGVARGLVQFVPAASAGSAQKSFAAAPAPKKLPAKSIKGIYDDYTSGVNDDDDQNVDGVYDDITSGVDYDQLSM